MAAEENRVQNWRRHHRRGSHRKWSASLVRRVARRPLVWWALAITLAATTVWLINSMATTATTVQEQWGSTTEVIVATRQVEVGDRLIDAVETRTLPIVAVPADRLTAVEVGHVARSRIHEGEIVVAARVSGASTGGLADRLPPGTSAVAVPSGPGWPPLAVGDLVDLHATVAQLGGGGSRSERVAERAVVVDVGERAVTVAVPASQVTATATALSVGVITVALVG